MKREYDFSKAKRGAVAALPKGKRASPSVSMTKSLLGSDIRSNARAAETTRASSTRCCDNMYSGLVNPLRNSFAA